MLSFDMVVRSDARHHFANGGIPRCSCATAIAVAILKVSVGCMMVSAPLRFNIVYNMMVERHTADDFKQELSNLSKFHSLRLR